MADSLKTFFKNTRSLIDLRIPLKYCGPMAFFLGFKRVSKNLSHQELRRMAKRPTVRKKQRYLEKISVIGIDPVLIEGKHFEADCLPPVESTDLLFFLVLETSFYTQQQFKAFRSLEAYNQMVSGFIASVQGHIIATSLWF